jgi:dCMP deaminase
MLNQAIVCYMPAIHAGYLKLLTIYPTADLYILDLNLVHKLPRLERDIRSMDPNTIVDLLKEYRVGNVQVLRENDITTLKKYTKIALPDEDVSRDFVATHLTGHQNISFEQLFLRWDRQISTTEFDVLPDRKISNKTFDKEMLETISNEAQKSPDWWRQVGAAIVEEGKILLMGHNRPFPTEHNTFEIFGDPRSNFDAGQNIETSKAIHAEASLIAEAARIGCALEGLTLYVTTFPCPVCAKSVAAAGIKKVFYRDGYSVLDAEDILKASGIEIILVR